MRYSQRADKTLFLTLVVMLIFSLVMMASIGVTKSLDLTAPGIALPNCSESPADCYFLLKKHATFMMVGMLGLFLATKIPYRWWRKSAIYFYVATLILLLIVLIAGNAYGTFAKSWLKLFNSFSLQPTEFAKISLILYLAHWMERKEQEIATLQHGFIPFAIVSGIILLPIAVQPDLGSVLVISSIVIIMYFMAGAKIRHMAMGAGIALVLGMILIAAIPHVNKRFQAFIHQEDCTEKYCWQTEQANIAVSTGGIFGKGLTQGIQKLYWLPQAHDDFVFAASAEELGLIRMFLVVVGYGIIGWRGFNIAAKAPDRFSMLAATGITAWVSMQAFINIAVNIGLMPVTGVTLPFMSSGGSSMVATLFAIGILLHISRYASENVPRPQRRWDRRAHRAQYRPYSRV